MRKHTGSANQKECAAGMLFCFMENYAKNFAAGTALHENAKQLVNGSGYGLLWVRNE